MITFDELDTDEFKMKANLERIVMDHYGTPKRISEITPLSIARLIQCATRGGAWLGQSLCQTNKCLAEAVIRWVCAVKQIPCIILINASTAIEEDASDKMSVFVRNMERWVPSYELGGASIQELPDAEMKPAEIRCVRTGFIALILPAHEGRMSKLNDFLEKHDIRGAVVICDEADNILKTEVRNPDGIRSLDDLCPPNVVRGMTLAEKQFYRLIGIPGNVEPAERVTVPRAAEEGRGGREFGARCLPRNGRVRALVNMTATSSAVLEFHAMWGMGFSHVVATAEQCSALGFVVPADFKPLRHPDTNAEVYLDATSSKANGYSMRAPQVRALVRSIAEDVRQYRMLLSIATPFVNDKDSHQDDDVTLQGAARNVRKLFDDACRACSCSGARQRIVFVTVSGDMVMTGPGLTVGDMRPVQVAERDRRNTVSSRLSAAISAHDDDPDALVVVLMNHAASRGVSPRSGKRVPTHAIIAKTRGFSLPDALQTLCRAAGATRALLELYGYGSGPIVLMTCSDLRAVQHMYSRTCQEAVECGTGRASDAVKYMRLLAEYPAEIKAYLNSDRRHGTTRQPTHEKRIRGTPVAAGGDDDEDDEDEDDEDDEDEDDDDVGMGENDDNLAAIIYDDLGIEEKKTVNAAVRARADCLKYIVFRHIVELAKQSATRWKILDIDIRDEKIVGIMSRHKNYLTDLDKVPGLIHLETLEAKRRRAGAGAGAGRWIRISQLGRFTYDRMISFRGGVKPPPGKKSRASGGACPAGGTEVRGKP